MSSRQWTLTDVDSGTYLDELLLGPAELGGQCRVEKRRLRGGLSDGVDLIRVDNGRIAFSVLPTRGMNLWQASIDQHKVGWQSPVAGPVHPHLVPLGEPGGLGWLDGFDELLARCGLESNGAPEFDEHGRLRYGLHGRISNRPARRVDVEFDPQQSILRVTGVVDESRFLFHHLRLTTTYETRIGEAAIRIRDRVTNLAATATDVQLLYHINLGPPLLDEQTRLVAPARRVVPRNEHAAAAVDAWDRYAVPQAGFQEQVYFLQLAGDSQRRTLALLENANRAFGASVHFALDQLPCFTLWKHTAALQDGYVTGLEPATNFPNPRSFERGQGRVVPLRAGGEFQADLELQLHAGAEPLAQTRAAIDALAQRPPELLTQPDPSWCA